MTGQGIGRSEIAGKFSTFIKESIDNEDRLCKTLINNNANLGFK